MTDSGLSSASGKERELVAWRPPTGGENAGLMHLDEDSEKAKERGGSAGWNQFETNEKLFGVQSSFREGAS